MTEEEAKAKWCPFARDFTAVDAGAVAVNRWGGGRSPCIASACMAWRPGEKSMFREAGSSKLSSRDLTGNGEWITVDGYCGLAGAPR